MPGHTHSSAARAHRSRLALALVLVATFFVVELVAGLLTGSLALLSDAGHMLTDVVGIGMALAAIQVAASGWAHPRRSFGLYRLEVLAALANAVLLLGVAGWVLVEAARRVADPPEVAAVPMLAVATVGLGVNLVAFVLLHRGAQESLNIRGAYLEVLADALNSVGAILAALVLLLTGWPYADPLFAGLIALFIVPRAWRLGREAGRIILQAAPPHAPPHEVAARLARVDQVSDVHDVHVWTLTSGMEVLTAHLVVADDAETHAVLDRAREVLAREYGIEHATVQIEPESHEGCEEVTW
ncbi:cation transporter [Egibacter rhizosphaerae]|uniref:Cation transporter n=1 Tax=Egibacter rhizosphaerae TaxID=1670831 RepID=A0A411YLA3_9ACTN|nr:cation diffusion facilitator family transporter [Egibacter rhizosphaerae]QBI21994.1 cation transporter [Egibacter rhizosphaerae]